MPELTYKVGSDSDSLTLSGASATVSLDVGGSYSGQLMSIYRSDDGQATFTLIGTCRVLVNICTFSTNKFSDFALVEPTDGVPDTFTFFPTTGVYASSVNDSNTVVITGMNAYTGATTTAGTLYINSIAVGTSGMVTGGDSVMVELTASSQYNTPVSATLTIGGETATYTVTTRSSAPSSGSSG